MNLSFVSILSILSNIYFFAVEDNFALPSNNKSNLIIDRIENNNHKLSINEQISISFLLILNNLASSPVYHTEMNMNLLQLARDIRIFMKG